MNLINYEVTKDKTTMKKLYLILSFLFLYQVCLSQELEKKLKFLLSVDNEIPSNNVSNFQLTSVDSASKAEQRFSMTYKAGELITTDTVMHALLQLNSTTDLVLSFSYQSFRTKAAVDHSFICIIPKGWFNEQYLILNIYSKEYPENQQKFLYKPGEIYVTRLLTPGKATTPALIQ
jgi:hypothetical protein